VAATAVAHPLSPDASARTVAGWPNAATSMIANVA